MGLNYKPKFREKNGSGMFCRSLRKIERLSKDIKNKNAGMSNENYVKNIIAECLRNTLGINYLQV